MPEVESSERRAPAGGAALCQRVANLREQLLGRGRFDRLRDLVLEYVLVQRVHALHHQEHAEPDDDEVDDHLKEVTHARFTSL